MDDGSDVDFISFSMAAKLVPGGVHRATISRWAYSGVAGVRLRVYRRAGRLFTTRAALAEFFDSCRKNRWSGLHDATAYAIERSLIAQPPDSQRESVEPSK